MSDFVESSARKMTRRNEQGGERMKTYVCDPLINKECTKTGCLYYWQGECFQTSNKEYALLNANGELLEVTRGNYDKTRKLVVDSLLRASLEALDRSILEGER